MEIELASKSGPCNCCGDHVVEVEQYRDDDGWCYCINCYLVGRYEDMQDAFYSELLGGR